MLRIVEFASILLFVTGVICAQCYNPTPAFPIPQWTKEGPAFAAEAFDNLETKLKAILAKTEYGIASTSIELTSDVETLWSYHHTARKQNKSRPGVSKVDGSSQYRIASITKTFTTLAILYQHAVGKLDINDPVSKYIPELADEGSNVIPWKEISIRAMASQLSGIPREFGQSDILSSVAEPWLYGLPPESSETIPPCFRNNSGIICNTTEIIAYAQTYRPLFAPNQQSTYSNLNFELLGIVIENVTGRKYNDYIEEAIFKPLNMSGSTLIKPSDEHAVIPDDDNYWDVDEGALSPTGGIYSTSSDLSKFLRYVLAHYNALVTGVNWFHPASFGGSLQSFYGMPWEIFRTDKMLLKSRRPVTFVTKGGGLPSYYSIIASLPEYNLGITILVGGPHELLTELLEVVTTHLVQAAETAVWASLENRYEHSFFSANLGINSSASVSTSASKGIVLESFVSNGTDVLNSAAPGLLWPEVGPRTWHIQLIPTLLYKNESSQQGEIFRAVFTPERSSTVEDGIWDAFCMTDIDSPGTYAGLALNEIVFWHERGELEMPAWRLILQREKHDNRQSELRLQTPMA